MELVMGKKRDRAALEARRMEGARLLRAGVTPWEVARRLKVSRTSVWRWRQALETNGRRALAAAPRTGRPPQLTDAEKKQVVAALEAEALAQGYATDLWTLARVGKLIEKISGKRYSESGVWRLLRGLGFSCQRPSGRAIKRDEKAIRRWKTKRWPALKKLRARRPNNHLQRRVGVSERPHRVRTWAPKGQTPVLQYSFTWNQLSAVAGLTFWTIYFKLVKGAVRAPEIVAFLKNLRRHLVGRKHLVIWDRLQAHRSRLVRDYVETQGGDIQLEFLPPYAPELNPVE